MKVLDGEVDELKKKAGGHAKERLLKEKEIKKLQTQKDKKVHFAESSFGFVLFSPKQCLETPLYPHPALQSPTLLTAKEEITRVNKRIKAGEKEADELKARVVDQKKALSKLDRELEQAKKGVLALVWLCG